ncbi:hypothetical protein SM033_00154 [Vibrio phage vB_VpaM_sm033]|nr:hypothetical protein SM033_00154 [Vibrio phage vB_VpaM_sm033]
MNLIDETSVWLQTHIDGENNSRFLQTTAPFKEAVCAMTIDQQKVWLVGYWTTQLATAGVANSAQTEHYLQAVFLSNGLDAFMRLLKNQIEIHNIPRIA